MNKLLTTCVAIFLLINCSTKNESKSIFDEVMTVHDEVMPKMEEVSKISNELKTKSEQLSKASPIDNSALEAINKSIEDLRQANQGMMKWMHEFNTKYDTFPEIEAQKYLKEEKLEIEQVKKDMLKAIEDARKNL